MHGEMSANKRKWSFMPTESAGFKKRENKHLCEASRHNGDRECRNSVMHVTIGRCNEKLKQFFHKITCIKTTTSIHWNQTDNNHTNRNTKSDRNIAQDMKSRLTLKQLSWQCQRILDAMWDVKSARSMWGMRYATSNWWVSIRSRLWRACHKSRKKWHLARGF